MRSILTKLAAAALAAILLLSATACGTGQEVTGEHTDTDTTPVADTEQVDTRYTCDLPDDLDFDGTEITIMCIQNPGREDELIAEESLGGSIITDAVYERNLTVERTLHVKLAYNEIDDDVPAQSEITRWISAGDTSNDIFTLGTNWSISPAIQGCYQNLKNIEYIDLDKHYWSQDYNDMVTFTDQDMQFLATSPAAISLFRLTYLTIFNRDLMAARGLPDLYEAVQNGEWTLDYQNKLLTDTWTDTNGDGIADDKDFYGFVTGTCISIDSYPVNSDITLIRRDENGLLYFDMDEANRMIDMAELVSELYTNQGTYCFPQAEQDHIGENNIMGKFAYSECLMATTQFLSIETNLEALALLNYGIVPMPKLSVEQADYKTYVQDQVTSFGISAAISDEDRLATLGAVMESIAYNSYVTVRPAYYDSTLSLRFMQDPQSRAILDTMFETIAFDYCFAIGVGGIRDDLRVRLSTADPAISSRIKSWERAVNNQLKRDNQALDKLS